MPHTDTYWQIVYPLYVLSLVPWHNICDNIFFINWNISNVCNGPARHPGNFLLYLCVLSLEFLALTSASRWIQLLNNPGVVSWISLTFIEVSPIKHWKSGKLTWNENKQFTPRLIKTPGMLPGEVIKCDCITVLSNIIRFICFVYTSCL